LFSVVSASANFGVLSGHFLLSKVFCVGNEYLLCKATTEHNV